MMENNNQGELRILIENKRLDQRELINLLRKQGGIPRLIQDWVLDKTLSEVVVEEAKIDELINKYKESNKLESDEEYKRHLELRYFDESILIKTLIRPYQIVQYREARWGQVTRSLYLKYKERFDLMTYYRLEAENANVMQEVYFRLKAKEESWDELARQMPNYPLGKSALTGPIPVSKVELPIRVALRQSEPGEIAKPIQIGNKTVVVALIEFKPSSYGDEVRTSLLQQAFDEWFRQECDKIAGQVSFEG